MAKLPYDLPASKLFRNLPETMTFRVWLYEASKFYKWGVLAYAISQHYECSATQLRLATKRLREGAPLYTCRHCGCKTTSSKLCTSCQSDGEAGRLTPTQKHNLEEHYKQSAQIYARNRDKERAYTDDEYTGVVP